MLKSCTVLLAGGGGNGGGDCDVDGNYDENNDVVNWHSLSRL